MRDAYICQRSSGRIGKGGGETALFVETVIPELAPSVLVNSSPAGYPASASILLAFPRQAIFTVSLGRQRHAVYGCPLWLPSDYPELRSSLVYFYIVQISLPKPTKS